MRFGLQWFNDGAHPSGVLTSEKELTQEKARVAKQRFMAALRGSREPAILGAGWKFETVQIAPNESQFLETQGMTSAECCRIFGPGFAEILGYEVGGDMTYTNVEQQSLNVLIYAVDPWLVRSERNLSSLLPAGRHVKYNRDALLRTDLLTRMKAHDIALRDEIMTVNEVRAIEDMPPVDWGDEPRPIALPPLPIDKPTAVQE
jgi:HK97 family phage portal protein